MSDYSDDDPNDDRKPAAASMPSLQHGFQLSPVKKKNTNGIALCQAVGCEKNAQANTRVGTVQSGGLCRVHHNAWLISTGQLDSWDCECGNKVAVTHSRCGECHRWRENERPGSVGGGKKKKKKSPAKKHKREGTTDAADADGPSTSPKKKAATANGGGNKVKKTHVPPESGVQISVTRETNDKGRLLCKVSGCGKLDQSGNDGFCRMHFNMFAVDDGGEDNSNDGNNAATTTTASLPSWTCGCGHTMSGKNKRCGKCNKVSFVWHSTFPETSPCVG